MFEKLFGKANRAPSYSEVTPQQVEQKRRAKEKILIVDVRESYEFKEGHIGGSKLIPLGQLGKRTVELGSVEQEVIVVCRSGNRSAMGARLLTGLGYKKVSNMRGGMLSWQRLGLPVSR
ncbi:MAG TPA: rhodanese-like domain-containing protein [Chloroflexia bacterium]|nr:rhodanese-like domain-containing protein [Chloroflexia bacterium]